MHRYDVIVIGGGCNGTGIARDTALRGLKTLLLDKGDFAAATTGNSSGMIHGGIRYLTHFDQTTTYHSSLDAGYIRKIAKYMVFRIPFIMAVPAAERPFDRLKQRLALTKVTAGFRAYDKFQALKGGKPHVRLTPGEVARLEPGIRPDVIGGVTMDEWGIDPYRLCVANALSAREHGADVRNYVRVTEFLRGDAGAVTGVRARDEVTGEGLSFQARAVVNATGPWAARLWSLLGRDDPPVRLRPGKGVHLTLDRRLSSYAVISTAIDGRQVFVMPHENTSIIGTTDDDYYGDPDRIPITTDEVEYLLEGAAWMFPRVREARVVRAWAGVRPTLHGYGVNEDELSRAHQVFDHAEHGAPGLFTIAGGKLAAYRLMAEEATDRVCARLGTELPCTTHLDPLPGADGEPDLVRWQETYRVPMPIVERLAFRHGMGAREILATLHDHPRHAALVCPCEGVIEAEVRHCIRNEWVRKGSDLMRRCRIAAGPCRGAQCIPRAVALMAEEQRSGPATTRRLTAEFLGELWDKVRPVLTGWQLAQEELHRQRAYGAANLENMQSEEIRGER